MRERPEHDAARARVVLRPIASPLPLGFLALSAATTLASGLQLGWLGVDQGKPVALILIAFVVPLQVVASVLGFFARDGAAGTGMGILAGTWLSVGLVTLAGRPGATSDALGLLLLVASVAMLVPASAALQGKLVPAAVLCTTSLRFLLTGLFQLTASGTWADAAGVVGLFLGALAVYAAFALELEDAARRTRLPVGRRGAGASALTADLDGQLSNIAGEPGVRTQL
jgi:succinate-acetate transporter protein